MKNKITIKNAQGEYLQHVIFEDQQVQDDFIQMLADTCAWGKPEHNVQIEGSEEFETIPAEYSVEIEDISEQIDQEKINQEAQHYLDSTDWMVIRFMESGVEMPQEISEARQDARERIVRS